MDIDSAQYRVTLCSIILHGTFNGVVEFLFKITVYLLIKDYSGMNIKNSTMLHTVVLMCFQMATIFHHKKKEKNRRPRFAYLHY